MPVKIFFCYSRKDKVLRDQLENHLEPLRRSGQIITWYDREIQPGMKWEREIDTHLNTSDVILLLISPNFMSSDYCYGKEMVKAMERHKRDEAHVIPVILRPVDWENSPIGQLQALPTDGKPITKWPNRDEAFLNIVAGIRNLVNILLQSKSQLLMHKSKQAKDFQGFAELLEELRLKRQISKRDLAIRSGLTAGYISNLTRGERVKPSIETINSLAIALELDRETREHLFEAAGYSSFTSPSNFGDIISENQIGVHKQIADDVMIDWGEAPHIPQFYGREQEIDVLTQWIEGYGCQFVAVLGIGGIGKTALAVKLAERIQDKYDYIFWRSLQNAPPLWGILKDCIHLISHNSQISIPENIDDQIKLLVRYLREHRCLIVLDNFETVFQAGSPVGEYRNGYEEYEWLLQRIGEMKHNSCFLLTSREKPIEVARSEGENSLVRSFQLGGLDFYTGMKILKNNGLQGEERNWEKLIALYQGNPLALKLVSQFILEVFGGDIASFLKMGEGALSDISDALSQQFMRLSNLEREVIYWLAIEQEPVSFDELLEDSVGIASKKQLSEILQSLRRRSIIEIRDVALFTLQPVVMEYLISRFIEEVSDEICNEKINLLKSYPLIKPKTKDSLKNSHTRLILRPTIEKLLFDLGKEESERKILKIEQVLSSEAGHQSNSYISNNIKNLLLQLKIFPKEVEIDQLK